MKFVLSENEIELDFTYVGMSRNLACEQIQCTTPITEKVQHRNENQSPQIFRCSCVPNPLFDIPMDRASHGEFKTVIKMKISSDNIEFLRIFDFSTVSVRRTFSIHF